MLRLGERLMAEARAAEVQVQVVAQTAQAAAQGAQAAAQAAQAAARPLEL
jgi:hypothetical protein